MKKRYVITGHGRGLGQAWYEHFKYMEVMGLEVMGFGQINNDGWNLHEHFEQVVEAADGCELFINNAYCKELQLKFLNRLHHRVGAMIISGSVAADDLADTVDYPDYGKYKKDLEQRVLELGHSKMTGSCDLLYLKLTGSAYRDTAGIVRFTDQWLQHRNIFFAQFIDTDQNQT